MMNDLLLINPPSPFLLDERVFVSLGILKVAAAVREQDVSVSVLDLSGVFGCLDMFDYYVRDRQPMCVGITATTPQMPYAAAIAKRLKSINSRVRVILGGPHVTVTNAATKVKNGNGRAYKALENLLSIFDVIVAGDGERSIFTAMTRNPAPLIDADNSTSDLFLTSDDLDGLLPARDLIDLRSYHYAIDGVNATSLIAQLGCPFGCRFCGGRASPSMRQIRTRTTSSILDEIMFLNKEYGYRGFMFYDDELNVSRGFLGLLEGIIALDLDLRLRGFIKSELFTEAQAAAMVKAGFRSILVGFESGSDRILRNINKRSTRQQNTQCMEIAKRYGLKVKALMSLGHPGESQQTVNETREWLKEVKPDDLDVTIITPYPGCPYYDEAQLTGDKWSYTVNGDVLYMQDVPYLEVSDYYKGDPEGCGYHSYVSTDTLTQAELVSMRDNMEQDLRSSLNIPFPTALHYEHSMGQNA